MISPELIANVRGFNDLFLETLTELVHRKPAVMLRSLPEVSKIMGGWRPREFTILCGSTGSGKTTLLAQWAADFVELKIPHLVMSVETGPHDFVTRMLSVFEGRNLNKAKLTEADGARMLKQYQPKFFDCQSLLGLYENRVPIDDLVSIIKHFHETKGIQFVLLDNLNFFMEPTTNENAIIEMDRVVHELVILCKQIDIHVVMVMHPKKTENGRVQSEFDIKGSSLAVQEAHNVILFNRPHKEGIASGACVPTDREFVLAKCRRNGEFVFQPTILSCHDGIRYTEK